MTRSLHRETDRRSGRLGRTRVVLLLGLACCAVPGDGAWSQTAPGRTTLVDAHTGTPLSENVRSLSRGGYELADGTPVNFSRWYSSDWRDLSMTWMTPVAGNLGVYWGLRTGERGEKYRIEPAVNLGLVYTVHPTPESTLSVSAMAVLGGWLREDTCTADYGAIGGVQTVNCRLAASTLPPAETLAYMADMPPPDRLRISIRYELRF